MLHIDSLGLGSDKELGRLIPYLKHSKLTSFLSAPLPILHHRAFAEFLPVARFRVSAHATIDCCSANVCEG